MDLYGICDRLGRVFALISDQCMSGFRSYVSYHCRHGDQRLESFLDLG